MKVGVLGKYTKNRDAYISVQEALKHAAWDKKYEVEIVLLDAEKEEDVLSVHPDKVDALVVPGGFGNRGVEGIILGIHQARINKVPTLGVCLGMQCMAIEYARANGFEGANSTEFDANTPYPVIDLLPDQVEGGDIGGTMRLGLQRHRVIFWGGESLPDPSIYPFTGRHRHRYELTAESFLRYKLGDISPNKPLWREAFIVNALSSDNKIVEVMTLHGHPYFVGCQFHPEFDSWPTAPSPLFTGLIKAAIDKKPAQ